LGIYGFIDFLTRSSDKVIVNAIYIVTSTYSIITKRTSEYILSVRSR